MRTWSVYGNSNWALVTEELATFTWEVSGHVPDKTDENKPVSMPVGVVVKVWAL